MANMDYLEKNTRAFNELSLKLELEHFGQIALFHEGELHGIFQDQEAAYFHGEETFGSGAFCIFPIGRERVFRVSALSFALDDSAHDVAETGRKFHTDSRRENASPGGGR